MEKLKSAISKLIILAIIATIMISGVNVFHTKAAASTDELFNGNITKRVNINDDIEINQPSNSATVSVTAPDGEVFNNADIITNNYKIKATLIGNYVVTYTDSAGEATYSYNVLCKEDKEYFINVLETIYDFIPSYKAEGETLIVPEAELVYENANGEYEPVLDSSDNKIEVEVELLGTATKDTVEITLEDGTKESRTAYKNLENGVVTLVYSAKLSDESKKVYRKEYNINVQSDFSYEKEPTISISSFTTTANTGTLFTLPKATVKDDYDTNPFVDIRVTGSDGKPVRVYEADADNNGYARVPMLNGEEVLENRETVKFSNDGNLSFFVALEGKYRVQYVAYNGGGKTSTPHTYTIDVKDKLAPVITELNESEIPYKWGYDSVRWGNNLDSNPTGTTRAKSFNLPLPELADNKTAKSDLTLSITIVNPNSRTVAKWEGTVEKFESGEGVALNSAYTSFFKSTTEAGVTDFGLKSSSMQFSFDYFNFEGNTHFKSKDIEKYGSWTINYTVRDEAGNGGSGTARRSVSVELAKDFIDVEKPVISTQVDLPKYILVDGNDNSFYVPTIGVTDNVVPLNRLGINYSIASGVASPAKQTTNIDGIDYRVRNAYNVKGGETFPIDTDGDHYYILIKEANVNYAIQLKDSDATIQLSYNVSDDVGNRAELTAVQLPAIEVITPDSISQTLLVDDTAVRAKITPLTLKAGEDKNVNLGSFKVTGINEKYRDYTGFELTLLATDNDEKKTEAITTTAWTYFFKNGSTFDLYVNDITFTPRYGGDYVLNARFYDLSGDSYVHAYHFSVADADTLPGTVGSSAFLGTKGNIHTSYALTKEYTVTPAISNGVIVRKIESRSFALVGNDFIGLVTSNYTIYDYIYSSATGNFAEDYFKTQETNGTAKLYGTYAGVMSDSETPVIEVQGSIPLHSAPKTAGDFISYGDNTDDLGNANYVLLPIITAYTPFENVDVEISVSLTNAENRSPKSVDCKMVYIDGDNAGEWTFNEKRADGTTKNEALGRYAFSPSEDGTYTITIKAGRAEATHTMSVGKRTLPKFTVQDQSETATEGDTLYIGRVVFTGDEDPADLTVTINVSDPNSSNAYSRTYKGNEIDSNWFTNYSDTEVALKSGTYTITFRVEDKAGNISTRNINVVVSSRGTGSNANMTALTTVLIIIGVLLIAGAIVYIVRFKAVKK